MPYEIVSAYFNLPVFALVASRLGGLIMFQPVLTSLSIPVRLRVLFVLGLAMLVTPLVRVTNETPSAPAAMALAMGGEIMLGFLIGSVLFACFVSLQMAGLLIAQESGLAFGRVADPTTGQQTSVLSLFYSHFGVVIYLIVGGHRAVLLSCLKTFDSIPLLGDGLLAVRPDLLIDALALAGEVAVRIAAPAVVALFLLNIALGFISRTMPQLNIATVGFSLKSLVGFALMAVSLPAAMRVFIEQLEQVVGWLDDLLS